MAIAERETTTTQQPQEAPMLNGWNLNDFQDTIEAVKQQPEAGKLAFRTHFQWDGGFGGDARTDEIEQLGQVTPRRFTMRGDHPPELLGHNTGATAVETLLAALGSCLSGTYAAQATARGIQLDGLEVEVEGKIDLNGFLGLAPVRPGLQVASVTFHPKANVDNATLRELAEAATQASPVFDSIAHPVTINWSVERA